MEPVQWNDEPAWLVDWVRGMHCVEQPNGCQYVMHSVEDENNHMMQAHNEPGDNEGREELQ